MNIKILFCVLLCKIVLSNNFPFELIKSPLLLNIAKYSNITNINDNNIKDAIIKIATEFIKHIIDEKNVNISGECKETLQNFINMEEELNREEIIVKFIMDSGLTKNELHYFDNCFYLSHIQNKNLTLNYAYLVYSVNNRYNDGNKTFNKTRTDYESNYYMNGLCIPSKTSCYAEDSIILLKEVNKIFPVFMDDNSTIRAYIVYDKHNIKFNSISYTLSYIIIIFMVIQFILVVFNFQICYLLNKCFKKENNNNNKKCCNVQKWIKRFKNYFSFKENFGELFNYSSNSTYVNNYSGLFEIRGLNALSLFFTILGSTFIAIYNSPLKLSGISQMKFLLENPLYSLIFIGLRYSPRIMISCSGYTFIYKYLCSKEKNFSDFKFIMYQSHKIFIFIMLIFFYKNTINFIMEQINLGNSPIWIYFQGFILGNEITELYEYYPGVQVNHSIFGTIFGTDVSDPPDAIKQNIYNYYWITFNEIIFFIFGILFISLGYRFNVRIDLIIIVLIILQILAKFFMYLGGINSNFNSTLYYYMFEYGKLMTKPFFNLPYFLIGIYSGLMNYTLQRVEINKFNKSLYSQINAFSMLIEEDKKKPKQTGSSMIEMNINNEDNENENNDVEQNIENDFIKDNNNKSSKEKILNDNNNKIIDNNENDDKNNEEEIRPFLKVFIKIIRNRKKNPLKLFFIILIFFCIIGIPIASHYIVLNITYEGEEYEKLSYKDRIQKNIDERKIIMAKYTEEKNLEKYISNTFLNILFRFDIEFVIIIIHGIFFFLRANGQNNILSFFTNIIW